MNASPASEASYKFQCAGEIERAEQAHFQKKKKIGITALYRKMAEFSLGIYCVLLFVNSF